MPPAAAVRVRSVNEPSSELVRQLEAIPRGGCDAREIHLQGLAPRRRPSLLDNLEARGLVERYPNAFGPEEHLPVASAP